MSDSGSNFPQRMNTLTSSYKIQRELVSQDVSLFDVTENYFSLLEAPFYFISDEFAAGPANSNRIQGEINYSALRRNRPEGFWDVEPGDILRVELIPDNFLDERSYSAEIDIVDYQSRSETKWLFAERKTESINNPFENGAVLARSGTSSLDDGIYSFFVSDRERTGDYESITEKLRSIYDFHTEDVQKAIEFLSGDYQSFSER